MKIKRLVSFGVLEKILLFIFVEKKNKKKSVERKNRAAQWGEGDIYLYLNIYIYFFKYILKSKIIKQIKA